MFSGTGTAVVTPFKSGKVDYESFERFLNFQINGGVDFLVVLGTTGEAPAVTAKEREEIVRFVVKTVEGRVPVVVGTGSNSTEAAIELSNQALFVGRRRCSCGDPYYNKPPRKVYISTTVPLPPALIRAADHL